MATKIGNINNNTLNGGGGNDTFLGNGGADTINAGGGDDLIILGTGGASTSDTVNGGAGNDTLILTGAYSSYNITYSGNNIILTQGSTVETVTGVENIIFDDASVRVVGAGSIHTTVQAGVNSADDGEIVLVAPGTWTEDVTITNKAIAIVGGAAGVVVNGTFSVSDTMEDGDVMRFENLSINADGKSYGINVRSSATDVPGVNAGSVVLDGVSISNANELGFFYAHPSNGSSPTNPNTIGTIEILNSTFADNGQLVTGARGQGHVNLFGFNGNLTVDGVTMTGPATNLGDSTFRGGTVTTGNEANPDKAFSLTGIRTGTPGDGGYVDAGNLVINDLTITGNYSTDAIEFNTVQSFASSSITDVSITARAPWGLINFDSVGGTVDFSGVTGTNSSGGPIGVMQGLSGVETYTGTSGADVLIGRGGADALAGGDGNDTYIVDNAGDIITEAASNGTDTVSTSVSYTLAPGVSVENLTSAGTGLSLTGNELAQTITGDAGDNVITGNGGGDTIIGGTGTDTAVYGSGATIAFDDVAGKWKVTSGSDVDTLVGVEKVSIDGVVYVLVDHGGANGAYQTIQAGINAASMGEKVLVAQGTYTENVSITTTITLLSSAGENDTKIVGSDSSSLLGTIQIASGVNGVRIGDIGQGFTIEGINGDGAIEKAALYITGNNAGLVVQGNEIVAKGDAGLMSEFAGAVTGALIDGNTFSGQTFTGTQPQSSLSNTFSIQFDVGNNAPRQLVVLGNGGGAGPSASQDITFTNNTVSGTTGGISSVTGQPFGNTLVTIDASNSTITDNTFTGTAETGSALRARRDGTDIENNDFDASGSGSFTGVFIQNNTTGSFAGNTFTGSDGVANVFTGTPGDDVFSTGGGDDVITGGLGSDTIDGGAGSGDTAVYTGVLADYTFTYTTDAAGIVIGFETVTHIATGAVDTLTGIEKLAIGTTILTAGAPVQVFSDATLVGTFTTIQAAIDAAPTNATIQIAAGTYAENVTVNKAGLTLQSASGNAADVVIEGTFRSGNSIPSGTTVGDWLETAVAYTAASGAGITVSADDVAIKNLTVSSFNTGVELGSNDGLTLDGVAIDNVVAGVRKGTAAVVTNFTMTGGSVADSYHGVAIYAATDAGAFDEVSIDGVTFERLTEKGIYTEQLSHAVITNIVMNDVGEFGRGPAFGAAGKGEFGAGIDVNLKYGTYSDIEISNFTFTDVGSSSEPDTVVGDFGAAIAIKARDDAPSYSGVPASASNVIVHDGTINGTSTGIRIGEPGKNVAGPAVTVTNVSISGADVASYDNVTQSILSVNNADGSVTLLGGSVGDVLTGTANDDTLAGGLGNDAIIGGDGSDTAMFSGNFADYTVAYDKGSDTFTLTGPDGTDTVTGVENLKFADQTLTAEQIFNDPPVAADDTNTAVEAAVALVTGSVATNDTDQDIGAIAGETLNYTLDAAVAGLTLNADGSYEFDPTDAAYQHLEDGVSEEIVATYTVTDIAGNTDTATLTITITGTNDAPVAVVDVDTATEGGDQVEGTVAANDSDVDDNASLTYALDAPVAGLTLNADGSYSFDPTDAAYEHLEDGVSTEIVATYTVTDDKGDTDTSTLTITITGTNDAPVAVVDTFGPLAENEAASLDVLANDTDDDDNAELSVTVISAVGTDKLATFDLSSFFVFDAETGKIEFNPYPGAGGDLNEAAFGTENVFDRLDPTDTSTITVTYTVSDSLATAQSTATFTINGALEVFVGTGDADIINGTAWMDRIDGGAGDDVMSGGAGNDTYIVDSQNDVIVENANQGTDTVLSYTDTYTLSANVENLTLMDGASTGIGNSLANVLTGNDDNNILDGAGGVDSYAGGLGDDSYVIDNAAELANITEAEDAGRDTVFSSVSFGSLASHATLSGNVEDIQLLGTAANAWGNDLDNSISGNNFANIIDGGAGVDEMVGGKGNDTYYVDNVDDTIIEAAGEGTDSVFSSVTYSLSLQVENLTLSGGDDIDGIGNASNNVIVGNVGNNFLTGGNGNDTLLGGAGNDLLVGGTGKDLMTGGTGSDTFRFNTTADSTTVVSTRDQILDFNHGESDKIDLSKIDANTLIAGDQAFTFLTGTSYTGTGTSGVAGQLFVDGSIDNYVVHIDVNGDRTDDFTLLVKSSTALLASDFIL